MNILFFAHYSSLYGANRSLINLIEGLNKKEINSFVILPTEGDLSKWLAEKKIPYKIIHFEMGTQSVPSEGSIIAKLRTYQYVKRQAIKRLLKNLQACKQIIPLIKEWNIDLLYSNSSVISIGWWLKKWTNKPYVLHIRELREAHYNFQPDWGQKSFKKHLNNTDLNITVSESVKKYYQLQNAKVIYNGVFFKQEIENFDPYQEKLHSPFTFGIIGVIHPNKGQVDVLKAFIKFIQKGYSAKLLIAGNGDVTEINKIIREHQLENNVRLLGHVVNPINFYKQVDATIVCSRYEAMGRVTVESMLMNVPVIGLDHSGTTELIEHQKTGFLFEDNQESLVNSMKDIVNLTNNEREYLVERAYNFAYSNFTVEKYADRVYQKILQLHSPSSKI